jgi:hypothetical protein
VGILEIRKKYFSNLREWWDIAKIKIKSITIEASKKVNITDDKIKALENKLETLKDISEMSHHSLKFEKYFFLISNIPTNLQTLVENNQI